MNLRIGAWSLVALGMTVNAACINFRPPARVVPDEARGDVPTKVWETRSGRGIEDPAAVAGSRLWVGGADRYVRAFALDTARELWNRRLPGAIVGGLVLRDSVLYVATARPEGRIVALNPATGLQLWRASPGDVVSGLGLTDDLVGVMNRRGELAVFHAASGRVRWRRSLGLSRIAPAGITGAFVVSTEDSILRVETSAGRVTHRRASPGAVLTRWRQAGSALIAPTGDSLILAIQPANLATAWQAKLDAPVTADLAVAGDTIWAVTRAGSIYRILGGSGGRAELLARIAGPVTSGIARVGDQLVVGGADGILRGFSSAGREVWRTTLSWNITVTAVPLPDGFIAIGGDGDVHRFRR